MNTLPTTTDELNDLLTADAIARAEARTLANIARRAQTLFTDGGYIAFPLLPNLFRVRSPKGDDYTVRVSETPDDELFGSYCSCPCFEKRRTCKHLQAVVLSIEEGAEEDAEWERCEEARNFFNGRYDR